MKKKQISLVGFFYVIMLIIGMKYNEVQAGPIGIACTDFATFKKFLELDDGQEYHVHLDTDITITDTVFCKGTKTISGHNHFLVNGIGHKNDTNQMIDVDRNSTLTIENYTFFDGRNTYTIASANLCVGGTAIIRNSDFHNSSQGIHVGTTGTLNFYSGTIGSGNTAMGIGAYGTVNFHGGLINGNGSNPSQGIHINGGKLNMYGGTISSCPTGAIIFNNATGVINNGTISSCKIGINNSQGTVTINGGKISNSTSYGIQNASTLNVKGGEIYGSKTAGIYNTSNTTMTAGTIYTNAIAIDNRSKLSVSGGTIRDNTAVNGAGIYHNGASCTITGGTFAENQNVYLAADDKFVITNTSTPTFEVKPNTYTRGRKVVQTSSASNATAELGYVSLFPNNNWKLRAVNADIKIWDKSIVSANYLDKAGNELAASIKTENWVGEKYTTSAKDIEGYDLVTTPENANGTFTGDNIEVNYIYDKLRGKVTITKVDINDNTILLKGATFKIQKLDSSGNIDTTFTTIEKTTGEDGIVEFTDLVLGKYKIIETKAPQGYELVKDEIDVDITEDNKEIRLKVTDKLKLILPETGAINYTLLICLSGLLVILFAYILKHNKKVKQ